MTSNSTNRRTGRIASLMGIAALCAVASFQVGMKTAGDVTTVDRTHASETLSGDVDGNGTVDREDVRIIIEIAEGSREATPYELRADPNQDGKLTVDDALRILRELPST